MQNVASSSPAQDSSFLSAEMKELSSDVNANLSCFVLSLWPSLYAHLALLGTLTTMPTASMHTSTGAS